MVDPAGAPTQSQLPSRARFSFGVFVLCALIASVFWLGLSERVQTHSAIQTSQPVHTLPDESFLDLAELSPETAVKSVSAKLRRGSTLQQALIKAGADYRDAHAAMQAIFDADRLDPKRLQVGLTVEAFLGSDTNNGQRIEALSLTPAPGEQVFVRRIGEDFLSASLTPKLTPNYQRVTGTIETSLYQTALSLGARDEHIAGFASAFAFDVDFQREIYPGDTFEMLFPVWEDERGRPVKSGEILYAALNGRRKTKSYYWHTPSDDNVSGWYDSNGESATRFLMKTPINGARLSSSFGKRRHPISGYTRLHKGTDFAAPTGTPIFAAGNGTVERASRYGGYGKYVRIRHANGYKTAYAHLSRYGRGVKKGRRVRQGDIIGYVGSTGASTGPHLHYEVIVNGKHVNAMRLNLPTGRKLANAEGMLAEFRGKKTEIDAIRARLGAELETAAAATGRRAN